MSSLERPRGKWNGGPEGRGRRQGMRKRRGKGGKEKAISWRERKTDTEIDAAGRVVQRSHSRCRIS